VGGRIITGLNPSHNICRIMLVLRTTPPAIHLTFDWYKCPTHSHKYHVRFAVFVG